MRPGVGPCGNPVPQAHAGRAQRGPRKSHAAAIEAMPRLLGRARSVERRTDYAGDPLLLRVPAGGDAAGATYVLHRAADAIHVAATRGDVYDALGTAPTLAAAIQRIRGQVRRPGTRVAA